MVYDENPRMQISSDSVPMDADGLSFFLSLSFSPFLFLSPFLRFKQGGGNLHDTGV